jgi:hypothetical protein
MTLKYSLRDIIPNSDSGERFQNSEPSIAVNPVDPTQMVAGIFSSSGASYFKSTDGGTTWSDYGSIASKDKTLAWKADGSAVLTASITQVTSDTDYTIQTYSGTTADSSFGSSINTTPGGLATSRGCGQGRPITSMLARTTTIMPLERLRPFWSLRTAEPITRK